MNSVVLKLASKYVRWILVVVSVLALLRGHNMPGGGFIGGLLAGLAVVYKGFAYTMGEAKRTLRIQPEYLIAIGLIIMLLSLLPGIVNGQSLMYGEWFKVVITSTCHIKIGTPFIFDIGVFLTVIGVTIVFIFALNRE